MRDAGSPIDCGVTEPSARGSAGVMHVPSMASTDPLHGLWGDAGAATTVCSMGRTFGASEAGADGDGWQLGPRSDGGV